MKANKIKLADFIILKKKFFLMFCFKKTSNKT